MKLSLKRKGLPMLLPLLFVFGGMFLAVESQAQSTVAQHYAVAPAGKSWVSTPQANLTVSQEIGFLTNMVNQLSQAGADKQAIQLAKRELLLWIYIQENLAAGQPVGTALENAHARISAGRGALINNDPTKQGKLQQWYDNAISKLAI